MERETQDILEDLPCRNCENILEALRAAEENNRKLHTRLLQSKRMEALGMMAGGVVHDFSNLLTGIISNTEKVLHETGDYSPAKENLIAILNASESAALLIRQMLDFSRKEPQDSQVMDLNSIVARTGSLLSCIIGKGMDVTMDLYKSPLMAELDPVRIEQVIINLAVNARDAMAGDGKLVIGTSIAESRTDKISGCGSTAGGRYILLSVADTGRGIDEKAIGHIFEPFFTTKESGKGTGLGLAIVDSVVKMHGGCITVRSEPGRGTAFEIYLPEARQNAGSPLLDSGALPPVEERELVLLADDDPGARFGIKVLLEEYGYAVVEAVDGEDAVGKFVENKARVRLLLLDVMMPKKNGKEVYEEVQKMRQDVKVLFMSGYTNDIIHKDGVRDCSLNFIPKPISPGDLFREVKRVLGL